MLVELRGVSLKPTFQSQGSCCFRAGCWAICRLPVAAFSPGAELACVPQTPGFHGLAPCQLPAGSEPRLHADMLSGSDRSGAGSVGNAAAGLLLELVGSVGCRCGSDPQCCGCGVGWRCSSE